MEPIYQVEPVPQVLKEQPLNPWDELSEKSLKKVEVLTEAVFNATNSIDLNLATDTVKVGGQNYACVSFVSPNSNQKCEMIGMKIRGVFDKAEDATSHCEIIRKSDPMFDVFVCDMYNWCLVPPPIDKIDDQNYQHKL